MHMAAGSDTKTYPNSPYPRDSDENGVRADRRTRSGEGMRLSGESPLRRL